MFEKRVAVFMGHYGSGKTFTAVNYALELKRRGKKVSVYDLDIVNPYFRTVDAESRLKAAGIDLIVSPFAESNVDLPAMNAKTYKMVEDFSEYAVADIGGDDRGALALGRFRDGLIKEGNYEGFLVLNKFRPETRDVAGALSMIEEIERAGRLPFTGIVNNANLGEETTPEVISEGLEFAEEVGRASGLPVAFSAVRSDLTGGLKEKIKNILAVDPIKYGNW